MRLDARALFSMTLFVCELNGCQGHAPPAGLLSPGAMPPDLSGPDQAGHIHHLSDSRGHFTVVYFYPKDDTPGCTKEACAFRDVWNQYHDAQVQLYGVSVDDQDSHASFAAKYALPFPIIADKEARWVKAFGVSMKMGKATRVSFLLSPDGRVNRIYPAVDPGTHAATVLADVRRESHRCRVLNKRGTLARSPACVGQKGVAAQGAIMVKQHLNRARSAIENVVVWPGDHHILVFNV